MITFVHPSHIRGVSDNFAAHVKRHSVNPGTDYLCPMGTQVVAVKAGTVTTAWNSATGYVGGRWVSIDHGDGDVTQYLHLDAVKVTVGQRVAQGELIALSGSSGNGKARGGYGPHLHMVLKRHGINIDFAALILQQTLNAKAGTALVEDGSNGPKTTAATKAFQKAHGLAVDGNAGVATWKVLDNLAIAKPPTPPAPAPEPTPPIEDPKEEPTMPNPPAQPPPVAIPDAPDVIIPAAARSIVYLVNWGAGVVISATVAGWLVTSTAPPSWLLVLVAVYSSVSGSVSLIAKANVPKPSK